MFLKRRYFFNIFDERLNRLCCNEEKQKRIVWDELFKKNNNIYYFPNMICFL